MDIRKMVRRGQADQAVAQAAPDGISAPAAQNSVSQSAISSASLLHLDHSIDSTDLFSGYADQPDPRIILDSIGEAIYDWDIVSDRLTWGPNAAKVLGLADSAALTSGRAYSEIVSSESLATRFSAIHEAPTPDKGEGVAFQTRYGLLVGDENRKTVWIEDTGRWFAGQNGKPERAHGLVRVITDHYQAERELQFRSHFDPQTGCLNRSRLLELTSGLLAKRAATRKPFCILLISVENLFVLNRTYGYDVADEAIIAVSHRLRKTMRAPDSLARYAGAKFALVLETCDAEQMQAAARRFLEEVTQTPVDTSAGPIPVNLRMGGVCAPHDGRSANLLYQHAEEALDLARSSGAARFVAYEASLARDDSRLQAARLADEVVSALNDNRIILALQPIVAAKPGLTHFNEALLRLRQPDGTIVSPGAILPIAEKAGLVHLLDQRVLELAVARLRHDPALILSVNVSGATLHDPDWPNRLKAMLARDPSLALRLIVEITETAAIADVEVTEAVMARARALGVRVAMDDFGAGHTSFRNLRRLKFDFIKMDGVFVQNLSRSADDRFFVRTLIDLAHNLGVPIVAEWVETAESADLLREWGVEYMQGVHFGAARIVEQRAIAVAA